MYACMYACVRVCVYACMHLPPLLAGPALVFSYTTGHTFSDVPLPDATFWGLPYARIPPWRTWLAKTAAHASASGWEAKIDQMLWVGTSGVGNGKLGFSSHLLPSHQTPAPTPNLALVPPALAFTLTPTLTLTLTLTLTHTLTLTLRSRDLKDTRRHGSYAESEASFTGSFTGSRAGCSSCAGDTSTYSSAASSLEMPQTVHLGLASCRLTLKLAPDAELVQVCLAQP